MLPIGLIAANIMNPEWQETKFRDQSSVLVSWLSARVFLPGKLCHEKKWLEISISYAADAIMAARALRLWPPPLRPIVHWFLPETRRLRQEIRAARDIIEPEVTRQRVLRSAEVAPAKSLDPVDWMDSVAKGRPYDMTAGQIGLSASTIHSTAGMITNVMYDLCANPEYFDLLREEVKTVFSQGERWDKTMLSKLKLMDSVMKESQRMNPFSLGEELLRALPTCVNHGANKCHCSDHKSASRENCPAS